MQNYQLQNNLIIAPLAFCQKKIQNQTAVLYT